MHRSPDTTSDLATMSPMATTSQSYSGVCPRMTGPVPKPEACPMIYDPVFGVPTFFLGMRGGRRALPPTLSRACLHRRQGLTEDRQDSTKDELVTPKAKEVSGVRLEAPGEGSGTKVQRRSQIRSKHRDPDDFSCRLCIVLIPLRGDKGSLLDAVMPGAALASVG